MNQSRGDEGAYEQPLSPYAAQGSPPPDAPLSTPYIQPPPIDVYSRAHEADAISSASAIEKDHDEPISKRGKHRLMEGRARYITMFFPALLLGTPILAALGFTPFIGLPLSYYASLVITDDRMTRNQKWRKCLIAGGIAFVLAIIYQFLQPNSGMYLI